MSAKQRRVHPTTLACDKVNFRYRISQRKQRNATQDCGECRGGGGGRRSEERGGEKERDGKMKILRVTKRNARRGPVVRRND